MDASVIQRLRNNHYAMDRALIRLKEAIEAVNNEEIYAAAGEVLLWVGVTDEWHVKWSDGYKKRRNRSESGKLILGLRHAYNSMKHNMNFIRLHSLHGGFTFPSVFPLALTDVTVSWIPVEDNFDEGPENQVFNYRRYIEGKEVIPSLEEAIDFLKSELSLVVK